MSNKARGHYHDGYANLAAAIIESGIECHDTEFLKSEWCGLLKEVCKLDDQMYGNRDDFRGHSIISKVR